ncbi:hypothetical protein EAE99_004093 [Botrytis elliptica]|nr:hypothetical protein EAE99_004093 [Botrytis elliptica]
MTLKYYGVWKWHYLCNLNIEKAKASAEKNKEFATNPQYRTLALKINTTKPESVQAIVDLTIEEFGRINYFVNSAGVGAISRAPTSDIEKGQGPPWG